MGNGVDPYGQEVLLQGVRLGTAIIMHSPDPPAVDVRRTVPNGSDQKAKVKTARVRCGAVLFAG
jgi:hypothetical protein